nr:MAG TPA: hypothetical protein [Caudoviricetes sp.]
MRRRVTPFDLDKSDAIDENERIFEAGRQQRKENRENNKEEKTEQVSVSGDSKTTTNTTSPVVQPVAKATNGIVVDVPIDDYMALMQMKVMTRRTLKDLALQAIHEFVERNKVKSY